jgi:hypothetical protein
VLLLAAACCTLLLLASPALGYSFGSTVTALGPEQVVFDWSTMACEPIDFPDSTAQAFRDSSGHVQVIASHFVTRRMIGPSLNNVRHDCRVLMRSDLDANPAKYQDHEWIAAPYTEDGNKIYALMSDEYQGWRHPGTCPAPYIWKQCWMNSITLAESTNGGDSYSHTPGPTNLVAAMPYPYAPSDGAYGVFGPSNIIKRSDGYYYAMTKEEQFGMQKQGACVMRTRDLEDPSSWRAWNGTGFETRFVNPYLAPTESPASHVCEPVDTPRIAKMADSLTYNTYFRKYLLAGPAMRPDPTSGATVWGFYYALSADLVHWSDRKLLLEAPLPWTYTCGPEDPLLFPSILDPSSSSRNFETTGQSPYLYYTRSHYQFSVGTCFHLLDRDLDRIAFQFTSPGAAAAAASFATSSDPARVGSSVTFDASASNTIDDLPAKYEWDLDGDGRLEASSGGNPVVSRSYTRPGNVTVRLRVTDALGDRMETAKDLQVVECGCGRRDCKKGWGHRKRAPRSCSIDDRK